MKIAVPADEANLESKVCISFGRTPYFIVYDLEGKTSEVIDNQAIASTGGAGIKAAQSIVDYKVDVLLTPRCGENAADVLGEAGISIYKTISGTIKENIEAYTQGGLDLLSEIHPGFHGGN